MDETLIEELSKGFPDKTFLTVDDVCDALACDRNAVYNWTRRNDPSRRPPRIVVGKEIRFPRRPFVMWIVKEQARLGM